MNSNKIQEKNKIQEANRMEESNKIDLSTPNESQDNEKKNTEENFHLKKNFDSTFLSLNGDNQMRYANTEDELTKETSIGITNEIGNDSQNMNIENVFRPLPSTSTNPDTAIQNKPPVSFAPKNLQVPGRRIGPATPGGFKAPPRPNFLPNIQKTGNASNTGTIKNNSEV